MTSTQTVTCEGCRRVWASVFMLERRCPTGDCLQVVCPDPNCHYEWYTAGPVLCRSCGDMTWRERQWHRISMLLFDFVQLPLIKLWRKLWRKPAAPPKPAVQVGCVYCIAIGGEEHESWCSRRGEEW